MRYIRESSLTPLARAAFTRFDLNARADMGDAEWAACKARGALEAWLSGWSRSGGCPPSKQDVSVVYQNALAHYTEEAANAAVRS